MPGVRDGQPNPRVKLCVLLPACQRFAPWQINAWVGERRQAAKVSERSQVKSLRRLVSGAALQAPSGGKQRASGLRARAGDTGERSSRGTAAASTTGAGSFCTGTAEGEEISSGRSI
jgi:predicted ABC-type sugar transport system permease subunit